MMYYCVHCQCTLKVPEAALLAPRARIGCPGCRGSFLLSDARPVPPPTPSAPMRVAAAPVEMPLRPVAAPPSVTPPPARPAAAAAASGVARSSAATAPALAPAATPAPRVSAGGWRRCAQHPKVRSEFVCPACNVGHCRDCVQLVRNAGICPSCEGLCVPAADFDEKDRRAQQRTRPLMGDLGTILGYPFTDTLAFVLMSVVVGLVNLIKPYAFGPVGLFSQGILMAYSFNALRKVANGDLKGFMPSIGDVADLAVPMRQGFFAFLGATWPLIAIMISIPFATAGFEGFIGDLGEPAAVHAQAEAEPQVPLVEEDDEEADGENAAAEGAWTPTEPMAPERTLLILLVLLFAFLWKVVYSPVALIVAVMTQSAGAFSSFIQTLNPLVGIGAIVRMGSVYWQALLIYCMIAIPQLLIGGVLGLIPFGGFFRAFVDGYAMLCIGCALGLAVFKKAPELGLD